MHLFIATLLIVSQFADAQEPAKTPPADSSTAHIEFAKKCEAAINAHDAESLTMHCDDAGFVELVMRELPGTPGLHQGIRESLTDGLSRLILKAAEQADSFTFLRIQSHEGQPAALFRVISDSGLNYHRLIFTTMPDGEHRVCDVYFALSGETYSSLLHRLVALSAPLDSNEAILADVQAVKEFLAARREGRSEDAVLAFDMLPDRLKANKGLQVIRLGCALKIDREAIETAARDFRQRFPGDPAIEIMLLDHYLSSSDFDAVHGGIAKLRKFAGEDAYLDYLEGSLCVVMEKPGRAHECYDRAIKREPTLLEPQWGLLELLLAEENHKATLERIRVIESLGVVFSATSMRASETYAEFCASPEFRVWLEEQKAKETGTIDDQG
jgi:hypothetical protein